MQGTDLLPEPVRLEAGRKCTRAVPSRHRWFSAQWGLVASDKHAVSGRVGDLGSGRAVVRGSHDEASPLSRGTRWRGLHTPLQDPRDDPRAPGFHVPRHVTGWEANEPIYLI